MLTQLLGCRRFYPAGFISISQYFDVSSYRPTGALSRWVIQREPTLRPLTHTVTSVSTGEITDHRRDDRVPTAPQFIRVALCPALHFLALAAAIKRSLGARGPKREVQGKGRGPITNRIKSRAKHPSRRRRPRSIPRSLIAIVERWVVSGIRWLGSSKAHRQHRIFGA